MAILMLVLFFLIGLFVAQFIGLLAAIPFLGKDFMNLANILQNPQAYPGARNALFVIQGVTALGGFIAGPMAYLHFYEKKKVHILSPNKHIGLLPVLLSIALVPTFMFFNSGIIEWNAQLVFPEFLGEFESWAKAKEEELKVLTMFLVDFENGASLWVALVVIAVLPGIGEELLFRGGLQNLLQKAFVNVHVAIWVAAIIFSAIHLQFYGFVPRLLLGALFGYIYVWSGNLLYPIIGHFVNNAFTLMIFYLNQSKIIDFDIEDTSSVSLELQLAGLAGTILLLYLFRRYFISTKDEDQLAKSI